MSEKKLLELVVTEKDGEFSVRVTGERAAEVMKCFPRCGCCCGDDREDKTAAACC